MQNKKKVIISILIILLVSISFVVWYFLPSTVEKRQIAVMNSRVDAFEQLYQFYVDNGEYRSLFYRYKDDESTLQSYYRKCMNLEEKCGLAKVDYVNDEYIMDEKFVQVYLQENSVESFVEKLYFILKNCGECHSEYKYCTRRTINNVLDVALQIEQIEVVPFKLPEQGSSGYYTEHPEEVPENREWTESGRFYTETGENGRTETRPCSSKVTVYGDFAVEHYKVYDYDPGAYGWSNGEFIDKLPSFSYMEYDVFHYKGSTIHEELNKASVFYLGDKIYLMEDEKDCGIAEHKYRPLRVLE